MKYFLTSCVCILATWLLVNLVGMWQADQNYALGKALSPSQIIAANSYLTKAVEANPDEPTFRDELAYNQAAIAAGLFAQKTATASVQMFISEAILNSNRVISQSPNDLPFWKGRTKVFYQLALIDPAYLARALDAIQKAAVLAPTDAKVHYNLGLVLAVTGQKSEAKKVMEETLTLKPDYTDVKKWLEENK